MKTFKQFMEQVSNIIVPLSPYRTVPGNTPGVKTLKDPITGSSPSQDKKTSSIIKKVPVSSSVAV